METEYIYEADLSAFGQGSGEGDGGEVQETEVLETDAVTEAAVAGIEEEIVEGVEESVEEHEVPSEGGEHGEMIEADGMEGIISGDQIPIMTAPAHVTQPDVEISQEDELKSTERLDRSSPDLWPQNCILNSNIAETSLAVPTAAQHILAKISSKSGEPEQPLGIWAQGLDPEDINLLHQFGSLTSSSLVEEVKKLQNIAYQLGLEEAKEMTRGKLLHVLDESDLNEASREKSTHVQSWK